MIEAAGRALVAKTGAAPPMAGALAGTPGLNESCLPLLEATCLFGQGVIRRGVATYALAEFHRPRSLPVLAASFDMGSLGGSNPAALALATFGKEGTELAAALPPPRPGEHDTGLRMTGFRGGAQVLAENRDIRGVDAILEGLAVLARDRKLAGWESRAAMLLAASPPRRRTT